MIGLSVFIRREALREDQKIRELVSELMQLKLNEQPWTTRLLYLNLIATDIVTLYEPIVSKDLNTQRDDLAGAKLIIESDLLAQGMADHLLFRLKRE